MVVKKVVHGAALAAVELESLVESARLIGPQLDSDVVNATRPRPPHLRQLLWTQDMRTASTCSANIRDARPARAPKLLETREAAQLLH